MNQYIRINDKVFPAKKVCELLGIEPQEGMKMSIGQPTIDGAIESTVTLGCATESASITNWFCPCGAAPLRLSQTEKDSYDCDEEEDAPVRTFLYDQTDEYVAYLTHNVKCAAQRTMVVASGDKNNIVDVCKENRYIRWRGFLSSIPEEGVNK